MKVRVRLNSKINAWECKLDESQRWYVVSKDLDQDRVFEYKYTILKYKVNQAMLRMEMFEMDIYPWALRLKEELNFVKEEHNKTVRIYLQELENTKAQQEAKIKQEEKERIASERLKLTEQERSLDDKIRNTPSAYNTGVPSQQEINIRRDLINGITKAMIKKKYRISNSDYRKVKMVVVKFHHLR